MRLIGDAHDLIHVILSNVHEHVGATHFLEPQVRRHADVCRVIVCIHIAIDRGCAAASVLFHHRFFCGFFRHVFVIKLEPLRIFRLQIGLDKRVIMSTIYPPAVY